MSAATNRPPHPGDTLSQTNDPPHLGGGTPQQPYGQPSPYGQAGPGQPYPQQYSQFPAPKQSNGLATAGFVLGLLGFLGCWIPVVNFFSVLLGVLGAILAAVGLAKSRSAGTGKGLAIAGLVLGVLAVALAVLINVAFVGAVSDGIDAASRTEVKTSDGTAGEGVGTSRDNPAPPGSEISGGDWTVTVNSVTKTASDSLGQKAESGSVLLLVNLTATYTGDSEQGGSTWTSVKYVSAKGNTIGTTDGSTLFIAEDSFDSLKTVHRGGSVTGNEILEVPATKWDEGVLAVSPGMFSDDTFVALK